MDESKPAAVLNRKRRLSLWRAVPLGLLCKSSTEALTTTSRCLTQNGLSRQRRCRTTVSRNIDNPNHIYYAHRSLTSHLFLSSPTQEGIDKSDVQSNFDRNSEAAIQQATLQCNLQLNVLARKSSFSNRTASASAVSILEKMEHPDTVSYNTVLNALKQCSSSHHKRAAAKAQELLLEMEDLHQQQKECNTRWYDRLESQELSEDEMEQGAPRIRIKPNVRSYSTVMGAWGKQYSSSGAEHAEAILHRLQQRFENTQDGALEPNVISYNTILNAWAKANRNSPEGGMQCERFLSQMPEDMADAISYNIVLDAWAKSGTPEAGERAESLLRFMQQQQQQATIPLRPDIQTFNSVMDAWSRCGKYDDNSAKRAHTLLVEAEKLAKDSGDTKTQPDFQSYSIVINAYARSKGEPLKAHRAFGLLRKMERATAQQQQQQRYSSPSSYQKKPVNLRPTIVTYNSVLNACASSCPNVVEEALSKRVPVKEQQAANSRLPSLPDLVRHLYQNLLARSTSDTSLRADHFTFGTTLKAVQTVFWGEPDQVEFGRQVFVDACEYGQVTSGVLLQFRQAVPDDVYRELVSEHSSDDNISAETTKRRGQGSRQSRSRNPTNIGFQSMSDHLPYTWRRNVKEDPRRLRNS